MGRKNRIFRNPKKFGRKFSLKPIMKKTQKEEIDLTLLDDIGNYTLEEEVKPVEVVLEKVEEIKEKEPTLQQVVVKKPKPTRKKRVSRRRTSKKKE